MIKTGNPTKNLSALCKSMKKINPTRILSGILVFFMLFSTVSCSLHKQDNTYSASGYIIDQQGKGVESVTVFSSDDSKTTQSGADGSWEVGDLSGTVVITPYLESTIFRPAKKEITDAEDNIYFEMFANRVSGFTSQNGEFIFNTPSGFEQNYKVTVIVEDIDSSESLNSIEVEAIYSGNSLDIIAHDNDGDYLPEVLIVDLENLDNYQNISIGNPAITVVIGLIAVGVKAYSIGKFVAGAILIAKGAGGITVSGVLASLGIAIVSEAFSRAFYYLKDNQKTEHPITIYIFENKEDIEATTAIKVAAGASIDDIMDAVLSVTGDIEVEILIPERNSAGAYYNPDGSPKVYYVYILENQPHKNTGDYDNSQVVNGNGQKKPGKKQLDEAKRKEVIDFMEKATSNIFEFLPEFSDPNDIGNDKLIYLLIFNGITPSSWEANDHITRFAGEDVEWAAKTIFGPEIYDITHRSVGQAIWEESEQEYHLYPFGPTSFTETHVVSIAEEPDGYIVDVIHLQYSFREDYDRLDETNIYDEYGNHVVVLKGDENISEEHLRDLPVRRYILKKTGDGGFYIAQSIRMP